MMRSVIRNLMNCRLKLNDLTFATNAMASNKSQQTQLFRTIVSGCCYSTSTSAPVPSTSGGGVSDNSNHIGSDSKIKRNLFNLVQHYEDIIGITAVREAQDRAVQAERDFSRWQDNRRDMQQEISSIQSRLKDIHAELDKTARGEDRYLILLTEEHGIIKKEKEFLAEFRQVEIEERNKFNELSARLRESHEKERERQERTKYWSIIGSIIGALFGIIGTTINNQLRMRELRNIVERNSDPGRVNAVLTSLTDMIEEQQNQVHLFISDLKGIVDRTNQEADSQFQWSGSDADGDESSTDAKRVKLIKASERNDSNNMDDILRAIKEQETQMKSELGDLRQSLAVKLGYEHRGDGSIVYIGPEVQHILRQTEDNLEWKMKIQTVVNVVLLYSALVLTAPLLASVFSK